MFRSVATIRSARSLVLAALAFAWIPGLAPVSHAFGQQQAVQAAAPAAQPVNMDRINELLASMTIEEKAGQMTQMTLQAFSSERQWVDTQHVLNVEALREALVNKHVGSILNQYDAAFTPAYWREIITQIQDIATKETRLGVPVIYAVDSVHGANYVQGATLFPQNLNIAATWNPQLAYAAGLITARETRAVGIPWNFAPVADVGRQPLWSRFFETFGEDPKLVSIMADASVRGMMTGTPGERVAACGKHFVAYSIPRSGKDRTPTHIGEIELLDTFVPPFEAMIAAGLETMMINSGEVNGVPVHASEELMIGLLRERLGFEGVIVTDWEDVIKLNSIHKIADSEKEATRLAVLAGIDMSMVPLKADFADHIVELVKEGALTEERIDESVRRILILKETLGLFDAPISPPSMLDTFNNEQAQTASLEASRESLVLLRNQEGLLPLAATTKLLVTGPTSDALPPVFGAWSYSWQGAEPGLYPDTPTVLDALRTRFGADNVQHVPGAGFNEVIDLEAFTQAAASADVIVLCLGEAPSTEKPGDIDDLDLEPAQIALAQAAIDSNKPVILVLIENRPRLFHEAEPQLEAIIWAGHPGPFGPEAIAELLAGDLNPSGKLPFTYPRRSGSLITYDRKWTEDLGITFQMDAYTPLFEFGSGLSYSTFEYAGLDVHIHDDTMHIGVNVTNTSERAGMEVVQVYVTDEFASVTPHAQRLKAFGKVLLQPGETRPITLHLTKDDLTLINQQGERVFEPGGFTIRVHDQTARVDMQ